MKASAFIWKAHYLPIGLLVLYPVILFLLTVPWCQRQFIFLHWVKWPLAADFDNPERYGLAPYKTRNFHLETPDGETLGAWHVLPKSRYQAIEPFPPIGPLAKGVFEQSLRERPTILYFHGNAANRAASHRVRGYSAYSNLDCNVIAIDYRGFANSTGIPSEQGLITDARTVWDYVHATFSKSSETKSAGRGKEGDNVVLIGQSLGTGVVSGLAGQLAQEGIHPRAIVLVAPFTSVTELIESFWLFGIIPLLTPLKSFPWAINYIQSFLEYPFDSTTALTNTTAPILILHARDDDVIPHYHSRNLFESLRASAPGTEVDEKTYSNWGTARTFIRSGQDGGAKGEVMWWDGLRGGHNDIGWAEGSIDLVRRIAGL